MTQVHIYSSPAHLPFSFARHFWFVVDEGTVKHRYEVLFYQNKNTKLSHILVDEFPHNIGLGIFPLITGYKWRGTMEKTFTGKIAEALKKVIESSIDEYPLAKRYRLWGPNSNTYVQWVLDVSKVDFKLPRSAIGKNFQRIALCKQLWKDKK